MRSSRFLASLLLAALMAAAWSPSARAQGAQVIYDDALENGWQNYGWATLNYASGSPVHSGSDAISVSAGAYQALYVHHADFDSTPYAALTFWINGGPMGGQTLQVQAELGGGAQAAYPLPALAANTWQQVTIPLAALGAAGQPNLDGFWIQSTSGASLPTFYVDDMALTASSVTQPTSAHLSVNAGQAVRTLDGRVYGLNTAVWDSNLGTPASVSLLGQMGTQTLRFPGGSTSDGYDWSTNRSDGDPWMWGSSFATFAALAQAAQSQAILTVNYGSGTPQMAAAWVAYSEGDPASAQTIGVDARGRDWHTVGFWASLRAATPLAADDGENFLRVGHPAPYGFRDWEIGNECYGSWENDQHGATGSSLSGSPHDAYTYAGYAAQFLQAMKAVDSAIKVGVVGIPGEDAWGDGQHPVPNPNEGNAPHSGWTPVVLATLASLGVTPDFVVHHRYAQNPGGESDSSLLQSAGPGWASDAADLRKMLTDYAGAAGAGVELLATEANSVSYNPGKQSVSLVNGLFYADSLGNLAQTEFNACAWWDFRNSSAPGNNNDPSLYGWRLYGDYGLVAAGDRSDTPVNTPYPTFYAAKLLTHWGRGGDRVVAASSDYNRLSVYAAKLSNGSLSLLVINKDPSRDLTGHIALTGFVPGSGPATVYQYGKPQDLANADLTQTAVGSAGAAFDAVFPSYSMTVIMLSPAAAVPTPPTIAVAAAATPAPVTGTQANVSVQGTDQAGASTLTYTWSAAGPAPVTFSPNGTYAARNAVATFTAAGHYTLTATVTDPAGLSVQSSVPVTVTSTLTHLTVTPATASVTTGKTQQFTAAGADQFGAALAVAPSWTATGGGTITSAGLFTAGGSPGGPVTVTASAGGGSGTASVTITPQTIWLMNDPHIGHVIGRADSGGWSANTAQDAPNFMQYGPYTVQVAPGAHTVTWQLMVDNNTYTGDTGPVVELQVSDATTGALLAIRDVQRREWTGTFKGQGFSVPFTLPPSAAGHRLEFRVYWFRRSYVREQSVAIQ